MRTLIASPVGKLTTLASLMLFAAIGQTVAQTNYFWSGNSGDSDWTTAGNWNTGSQTGPAATDSPTGSGSVTINLGSTSAAPVTLDNGATTTIGTLFLGNAGSGTAYLTIDGANTLLYSNLGSAGYSWGQGTNSRVEVSLVNGGSLTLNGTGQVVLGSSAGSSASLTVGNGSTLTTTTTSAFRMANNSTATASLTVNSGGTVNIALQQLLIANATSSHASIALNGGSLTAGVTQIGAGATSEGSVTMTGGALNVASLAVGTGVGSVGTFAMTGGTMTSTGGLTIANAGAATGLMTVKGASSTVRLNAGNTSNQTLQVGQNAASGSAGTLLIEGGSVTPAAGATNGFNVQLYTPATNSSTVSSSSIQGYGTLSLGGTGTKTFTNGGKVIASGANLVSGSGPLADRTLDLSGGTFNVAVAANAASGAGWYAVNQGKLVMNVSGTAAAKTLYWGAPTGAFSVTSLVNSAMVTFNANTVQTDISISLLSADRSDIANLFSQPGLPVSASGVIGLWQVTENSANTWEGLTIRYDNALASGATPSLYYISGSSGTWTLIGSTVDAVNYLISDNVASLDSGYYAVTVPEPSVANLILCAGGALLLFRRRVSGSRKSENLTA